MKIRLLFLLLFSISPWAFSSHAQQKMTPEHFNDSLVKVTSTLYILGTEWGTKFASVSSEDKDFSKLGPIRQRLSDFISTQTIAVKQLRNTGKGAEAFKKAMLNFLSFESEMIRSGFVPMESLGSNATEAEIQKATANLTDLASKESEALDKVNKAQEKYAAANGIELDPTE